MIFNCFKTYYMPVITYVKSVFALAIQNDYQVIQFTISASALSQAFIMVSKANWFGVPMSLIALVILTVLIDARYGIKKSKMKSRENTRIALEHEEDSVLRKKHLKLAELQRFQPIKLQFTFFKCFTLLAYLFFVKNLLEYQSESGTIAEVIGFATGVITKAPLGIFWYYDFKSIGENTAFIYGKKAPIFTIVEKLFEPKIKDLFNKEE